MVKEDIYSLVVHNISMFNISNLLMSLGIVMMIKDLFILFTELQSIEFPVPFSAKYL